MARHHNPPGRKSPGSGMAPKPTHAGNHQMQLGAWQLWRSLPRPCKIFLVVCVVQAIVAGTFAARELTKARQTSSPSHPNPIAGTPSPPTPTTPQPGASRLQDLILILISAVYFLLLVLDAFWKENGYQLLVSMASGGLNLAQLIVYATALDTGNDGASLFVVVACAVLQAVAVALARWAYLGFGWRMYSKIACDATLPDAERRRAIGLRLDRFSAVAKLDIQIMCLLLVVGVVNGANPSGSSTLVSLIVVAAVGVTAAAAWLAVCWAAVVSARPRLGLAAEFTYPLCYIVAAAFMFSSVAYGSRLQQLHGQAYLLVYPVLFLMSHTWVWWDARLLSFSGMARQQRDFAAARRKAAAGGRTGNGAVNAPPHVPPEILPLVHGAWLLKLPSASGEAAPSRRSLRDLWAAAKGTTRGRWRYFQLSHDGSTLRWDWRKFVLLVHIESVSCCPEDLTITLSLTLEPDLRLKFPDAELHAAWARGLTLLVMLLGNPDGLDGGAPPPVPVSAAAALGLVPRRSSLTSKDSGFGNAVAGAGDPQPGSPNRLLYRLASGSHRPSAAGLLTKEALEYAAWQARKVLGDSSQPPSPEADGKSGAGGAGGLDIDGKEEADLEKGGDFAAEEGNSVRMGRGNGGYQVISLHATAASTTPRRPGSGGVLRQRTPTMGGSGTPPMPPEASSPSPSKNKRRREPAVQQSWLRRTLTAPVSTLAAGLQSAAGGGSNSVKFDNSGLPGQRGTPTSPFDVEANAGLTTSPPSGGSGGGRRLFTTPPRGISGSGRARHLRSASLDGGQLMPPVPEGSGSFTPTPALPPAPPGATAAAALAAAGGGHRLVAQTRLAQQGAPRASSTSPGSAGGNTTGKLRPRPGSPLKNPPPPAAVMNHAPLMRYSSAPMFTLQRALSGLEPVDSETSTGLPPPPPGGAAAAVAAATALQRMGSDASWHVQSPGPGLMRHDSLGPQIAPGSKLWQAMFDAGMATYQMNNGGAAAAAAAAVSVGGGSVDGSPSPSATPHSVARSVVAVNMELIDFDQLTFGRMLGEGAEGPVYAAWFQETPVAVKRASCQAEVDLHLHAGWHDNVVNLRGLAQHGGHTYLVMELCPRGTLDVLIHQGSSGSSGPSGFGGPGGGSQMRMDPAKLLPIVRSIARGMLHLHTRSPPVLHRDLKPANVFVGHGYVMKIGDFGMARYGADTRAHRAAQAHLDPGRFGTGPSPLLRTLTPGVIGTPAYCAPELLHPKTPKASEIEEFNEERLLKADVYSFGVLLWELLERRRPYGGLDGFQIQTQWVLDPAAMRLPPPRVAPDMVKSPAARRVVATLTDLVVACTAWDPDERPSFREILATLRAAGQDSDAPPTPVVNLASPF